MTDNHCPFQKASYLWNTRIHSNKSVLTRVLSGNSFAFLFAFGSDCPGDKHNQPQNSDKDEKSYSVVREDSTEENECTDAVIAVEEEEIRTEGDIEEIHRDTEQNNHKKQFGQIFKIRSEAIGKEKYGEQYQQNMQN